MTSTPIQTTPFDPWLTRLLVITALVSLLIRTGIAATFPITGDEAFFYSWSVPLSWGSTDHPPMVAWWMALMQWLFGKSTFALRLPATLLPFFTGAAVWWGMTASGCAAARERAAWAVGLYWLTPFSALNVMVTTDTPLVLWSAFSIAALMRAEARPQADGRARLLYAACGLAWSLGFLSKYFAVVLALAYAVYFLAFRRDRLQGLALVMLFALPGPLINLAYNWAHCWTNIMFNVYNRNAGENFSLSKPGLYVLTIAYLATPAVLWWGLRHWRHGTEALRANKLLACVVLIPLGFFGLLSLLKVVGLHWVLSFYPFAFALLALALPEQKLRPLAKGIAVFTGLHLLVIAGLYMTTLETWKATPTYPNIVRSWRTAQMLAQVQAPGVVLMANAWTPAAIYAYERGEYMPSFGVGDAHARQDDLRVDFSIYEGKTIRIIRTSMPDMADYRPYFLSTELLRFQQDGAMFYAVEGKGFDYAAYKAGVLTEINRRYYRIPAWLPTGECAFCQRLCGANRCAP